MYVRRRPTSQSGLLHTHSCSVGRPQAVCVCWHGAVYVLLRDLLQPALGCMGRRPGHQHAGAPPPPCVMVTGLLHTHTPLWGPQTMCVSGRGAGHVPKSERFQPACGSLGRSPVQNYGGAPPPCVMVTGLMHTHTPLWGPQAVCACAGAAQSMFYSASAFNQPVEAWDVSQVTNMWVRRRPASGSQGSGTHTAAQ